jgi:hypothetical protein
MSSRVVYIPERIFKREFGKELPVEALDVLRRAIRNELAVSLAAPDLPSGTRLFKAYATSNRGPRRVVYLLLLTSGLPLLLFYRDKADKIGSNITIANPAFKAALRTYLTLAIEDLNNNKVRVVDLGE